MTLRVTLVSFDDDPPRGGQGVLVCGLRTALVSRGVVVTTVSGHGTHAIPVPRRTGRAPLDLSLALNRDPSPILATRPDVIWAMGGPGGVLVVRDLRVPVVYVANHTYTQAHRGLRPKRVLALAERRAYRLAARVVAISPSTARAVLDLGVPSEKVTVLMPGIDVDRFAGPRDDAGEPSVLFVGRLEDEKGALDAVAVMRRLGRFRPGVRGVVIGSGSREREVRAAAGEEVAMLGSVAPDRLAAEYRRATIVLVPSRYEGLGLVALEAMAAGAVVVGYDVDGLRDAVDGCGVLVDPRSGVDGLVLACLDLLDRPEQRRSLSSAGRDLVRRRHAWPDVAQRFEGLLREAATQGRRQVTG